MVVQCKFQHRWRLCATVLAFTTFMTGSFLFASIVFPIIRLLPLATESKRQRILQLIHWSFKVFVRYIIWLKIIDKFEVEGLENIKSQKSYILIANHPTLIDIIAIMSCIPSCNCIVKKSLWDRFCLGNIVRAAGYIQSNRASELIDNCEENFKAGFPLVIFPEGTRSPPYGLRTFHRGAAQIALRTMVPIVLVVITCDPPALYKDQPWYIVPARPMRFKLHFQPLVTLPKAIYETNKFPIKVRILNQHLEDFFRQWVDLAAKAEYGQSQHDGCVMS